MMDNFMRHTIYTRLLDKVELRFLTLLDNEFLLPPFQLRNNHVGETSIKKKGSSAGIEEP